MSTHRLSWLACGLAVAVLAGLVLGAFVAQAQDQAKDVDKIPKKVMDALKSKFPNAIIHTWTKANEEGTVVYDIEFKEKGRPCEADIKEDGTYINYEKAIEAKDLPRAVREAVDKKFPRATFKEIMEETVVKGKDEKVEAYELVMVTADKKNVELKVGLDGKILEEADLDKPEKKDEKKKEEKK